MHAAWFWIDRWRKSTAYSDMTLAEMGAYRNLLDELWLRDGLLPLNERVLGKIAGSESEWPMVRNAVMAHFVQTSTGWRNDTHDAVQRESLRRAEKQARYRNKAGNVTSNGGSNVTHSPDPSPDPYSGSGSEEKKISKRQTASHGNGSAAADGFDRFWAVYPNKKHKDAARKAWVKRKFSPNQCDAVLASIAEQVTWPEWTKDGGQFIPHPATWLNGGGWNDAPRTSGIDEVDGRRARAFCDRFGALFTEHRHGATYYRAEPARDFQRAVGLVRAWSDERLERLVIVFFHSDDPWIVASNKSLDAFAFRAAWCDDRLCEWEHQQQQTESNG